MNTKVSVEQVGHSIGSLSVSALASQLSTWLDSTRLVRLVSLSYLLRTLKPRKLVHTTFIAGIRVALLGGARSLRLESTHSLSLAKPAFLHARSLSLASQLATARLKHNPIVQWTTSCKNNRLQFDRLPAWLNRTKLSPTKLNSWVHLRSLHATYMVRLSLLSAGGWRWLANYTDTTCGYLFPSLAYRTGCCRLKIIIKSERCWTTK